MSSAPSSGSKQIGFTVLELLIAMAVLAVIMSLVVQAFASGLQSKRSEDLKLEVQQSLKTAIQVITQDLRSSKQLHIWNKSPCASTEACSTNTQIGIVTTDGQITTPSDAPGTTFSNATTTNVCDARAFAVGDVALQVNGNDAPQLYQVTSVSTTANHALACQGTNVDSIGHTSSSISGTWNSVSYVFHIDLATYSLQPDPLNASQSVLQRRSGLGTTRSGTGVVSFDMTNLSLAYGIPSDLSASTSTLVFYSDLSAAASAKGTLYSAYPNMTGKTYVGTLVRAVRVTMTGQSPTPLPGTGIPYTFTLSETVDLRR